MKTITHTKWASPKKFNGQAQALNLKQSAKSNLLFAIREMIFGKRATHSLPKLAGLFLIGLLSFQTTSAQQLLDNFNRSSSNTVGVGWTEVETATSGASIVSNTQLQLGSSTQGVDYVRQDVSSLFNTTFSSNTGILTWMFNMRQARTDPSGFSSGSYGVAFIIGGDNTSFTTGNGYAVVLGQSGGTDNIRFVRYTNGMNADGNLTNIITGAADYSTEYFAIKVTYNPTGNNWSLYVNTNGAAFNDPTVAAYTQVGVTTANSNHTSLNLKYTGCFWNHNNGSERALFDNIYVPSVAPVITTNPSLTISGCEGSNVTFTAAANYDTNIQWQKLIAAIWTPISGANSDTYTISSIAAGDAGNYRVVYSNSAGTATSTVSTLTVNPAAVGGTVSSSATVCTGSNSGTLTLAGEVGTITRWESSINSGSTWSPIVNTTSSQTYTNISVTTQYRVFITNGVCTSTSSVVTITSTQPSLFTVNGGGSICVGGAGISVGLSGSTSGVEYQLLIGGSNTGAPIIGTGSAISFGLQTLAGTYTVVATDVVLGCTRTMTGSVAVVVNPAPVAGTISGPAVVLVCSGSNSGTLSLTGQFGTIAWQSSINGGGTWVATGNATTSQSYINLAVTTQYRAVLTNTGCTSSSSNVITIVSAQAALYNVTGGGSFCANGTGVLVELDGSDVDVDYQLKNGASNVGLPIAGTGNPISFGLQTAAGTYTVVANIPSIGTCTRNMTGNAIITVLAIPTITASTTNSLICGTGSTFLSSTGASNSSSPVTFTNITPAAGTTIPNSSSAGVLSTITVSGAPLTMAQLVNFSVTINANHANDGEFEAYLVRPGGTTLSTTANGAYMNSISAGSSVCLVADVPTNGDNFVNTRFSDAGTQTCKVANVAPFTGTYLPENLFSTLTGNPNGIWTLKMLDDGGGTVGTFQSWSITFNTIDGLSYTWSSTPLGYSSSVQNPGIVSPIANITYHVTATNSTTGCTSTSTTSVTVDPILTASCVVVTNASCFGAIDGSIDVTAVGGSTLYTGIGLQSGLTNGVHTFTVYDDLGCSSTCSSTITVTDALPPVIFNCPANITMNNTPGLCNKIVSWIDPTASDNCSVASFTSNIANGSDFYVGTTTVTYTAIDPSGNQSVCTFNVTVLDVDDPIISNCPANISVGSTLGLCGANVSFSAPTAIDNCSIASVTPSIASGSLFNIGTTTVTYTATDASGNVATCSFDVTVNDTEFPTLAGCPSNISLGTSGLCSAIATWSAPTAADNCSGVVLTSTHNSGDVFPIGTTTVTYTATDAANNVTTCSFNVIVADNENPVMVNCPADIIICSPVVLWIAPTATDNCSAVVTSTHTPGSTFAVGTTLVTYTATDPSGNSVSCSFNVTVNVPSVAAASISSSIGNSLCVGTNDTLRVVGGSLGTTAQWVWYTASCGGVQVGTGTELIVTPSATTTYFVRAEGACGNSSCATRTITVYVGPPSGNVTLVSGLGLVCPGTTGVYSVNTVPNTGFYSWSAPAGTLINGLASPVMTPDTFVTITFGTLPIGQSGYNICVFAANDCGSTNNKCVWIRGNLGMPIYAIAPTVVCAGTTVTYTLTPLSGAVSYIWTATGGATVSGTGASVSVTFPANFTTGSLCVSGQSACGLIGAQRCISISSTPGLPGAINGLATVCPSSTGVYSIVGLVGASSYIWTVPAGATLIGPSNGISITVSFSAAYTTGLITVKSVNTCGTQSGVRGKTVSTGKLPTPGNITGDPTSGVCGQTYQYSIPSLANVTLGYVWTVPAGVTVIGPATSNSITLQFPSNFISGQLCAAGNNSCGLGYARCINVYGNPSTPGVISGSTSVCFESVEMYTWAPVPGATYYQIGAPIGATIQSGNITTNTFVLIQWGTTGGNIGLKAVNGCGISGTRTLAVAISCRTAAEQAMSNQLIVEAYPNPNHGKFSVSIDSRTDETYTLKIMDQTGRVLKVSELKASLGMNVQEFDLDGIAAGMYMLRIETENKEVINKTILIQ